MTFSSHIVCWKRGRRWFQQCYLVPWQLFFFRWVLFICHVCMLVVERRAHVILWAVVCDIIVLHHLQIVLLLSASLSLLFSTHFRRKRNTATPMISMQLDACLFLYYKLGLPLLPSLRSVGPRRLFMQRKVWNKYRKKHVWGDYRCYWLCAKCSM